MTSIEVSRSLGAHRLGDWHDANNVWRTKLRLPAVVISTTTGEIVWKGVGEAEDINSPTKGLDFGVIIFESRNPEIEEFLDELVSVASNGLAEAIAPPPASPAE